MHFFVAKLLHIAVTNYTFVYHLRNLRPMIRLIWLCTQRINFSMRSQHVRMNPCRRFATLTVRIYLYQFSRNYFSYVARSEPAKPARKKNLTRNSHSRSFKVTHFEVTEKPTTDCISLYNNAGLISKVSEEIASENAENCRRRQPHCRLTPLSREPPRIYA